MQQTPGCLPIPNGGVTRQPSFGDRQFMLSVQGTPPGGQSASPSSNPHSGLHPGSYHALSFSALALGATAPGSSPYSSSMAMSISPPRWGPGSITGSLGGSGLGGFGSGFGSAGSGLSGSAGAGFVGSFGGALGTSFGRQAEGRERELEAKYVKDFTCCGRQLSGLHELLEHYEEEHAGLAADVRMAAINAATTKTTPSFTPNTLAVSSDVPSTPGIMDMDMDMDEAPAVLSRPAPATGLSMGVGGVNGVPSIPGTLLGSLPGGIPTASASPWSAAFRPNNMQPPACVPPSVLSYPTPQPQPASPAPAKLTQEQLQAKALKKAQKKANASTAGTATPPNEKEGDHNESPTAEEKGEKRFRCPIEGCGKVYKQANGLKYHLTRSINSGHGNVAAMGGLLSMLGQDEDKS